MESNRPFGWAYIGAGMIARQTASVITKTKEHRIVSVYNRTLQRAEPLAAKYAAKACGTIEEAVRQPGVEGAYIATLHTHHYEAVKECLQLGIPVLCEKPFTVTKREAEELAQIARDRGVYLAEAMWTWFSPVTLQVKKWIDEGAVGKIQKVHLNYALPTARLLPRLTDPNGAGGALLDTGVYPITYCYNLFGYPESISCEGQLQGGVDQQETVTFRFPGGLEATCFISMITAKGLEKLTITGSDGTIKSSFFHVANKAVLVSGGRRTVIRGNGGYDNEFTAVAGEIRQGLRESAYVPLNASLDVMGILDECRRQLGLVFPFEQNPGA